MAPVRESSGPESTAGEHDSPARARPPRVVHLSSVHPPYDPRILHKETASLARAGHEVVLVVPHTHAETVDGVRIAPVPPPASRLARMTVTGARVFAAAWRQRADLYHFHDPELIPWALLLRLRGVPVIYDIHEDHTTGIAQKPYLPRFLRRPLAGLMGGLERLAGAVFAQVIAEAYYIRRFPRATPVLNYPTLEDGPAPQAFDAASRRLLYTGNVTPFRGAFTHVRLLHALPEARIHLVGHCPGALAAQLRARAGDAAGRLSIEGEDAFVPFARIAQHYREGGWLAGLALFPDTPHYREKALTKFFEYMRAGLPIVCSDFPAWRALVADTGTGLCVDPEDVEAQAAAIRRLAERPEEARAMGARGQELVRTRYNWQAEAENLLALYRELLGARAVTPA